MTPVALTCLPDVRSPLCATANMIKDDLGKDCAVLGWMDPATFTIKITPKSNQTEIDKWGQRAGMYPLSLTYTFMRTVKHKLSSSAYLFLEVGFLYRG